MERLPCLRITPVVGLGVHCCELAEARKGNLTAFEKFRSHDAAQGSEEPFKLDYGIRSVVMNRFAFLSFLDKFSLCHINLS